MKNDEPEIKPAYKNPLMEHYECDGQISLFDYEEQTQKTDRPECSRAGTGHPDTAAGRTDAVNARR